jgi:hypothetical protein
MHVFGCFEDPTCWQCCICCTACSPVEETQHNLPGSSVSMPIVPFGEAQTRPHLDTMGGTRSRRPLVLAALFPKEGRFWNNACAPSHESSLVVASKAGRRQTPRRRSFPLEVRPAIDTTFFARILQTIPRVPYAWNSLVGHTCISLCC